MQKIQWDTEQGQFYPSVEHVDVARYNRDSRLTDIVYLAATFMISTAAVELIKAIIGAVGDRRRSLKG